LPPSSEFDADVVVIGAGAAGIIAAWRAASLGARVVLLEKTARIGTKILISGGGKCNITHDGPIEDLLRAFRPEEGRFLRPSFYRFKNTEIVEMLTDRGLEVYTRPDGRIFPVDRMAKDVVAILESYLREARVNVRLACPVTSLNVVDGRVDEIRFLRGEVEEREIDAPSGGYRAKTAKNLLRDVNTEIVVPSTKTYGLRARQYIVCVGGSSYPNSGTTGDGWPWLRAAGHTVAPLRAALAPLYLNERDAWVDLAGVALRDIVLKGRQGKEFVRWSGDMLFTHQGISGPSALAISRLVAERIESGPEPTIEVDLMPNSTPEEVGAWLQNMFTTSPHRRLGDFLEDTIPARVVERLLIIAEIPLGAAGKQIDRKSRNRLAALLKGWTLGRVRHVSLEKGEVVAGGVVLSEVDPKTMQSRLVENLFLCGEILDIAGPVGGYNLQAAFATGFVAAESTIKRLS